jgi:hypothetical protein
MRERSGSTDSVRSRLGRGLVVVLAVGGLVALPATPAPAGKAVEQDECFFLDATIVDLREGAIVEGTKGDDVIVVGAAASVHAGDGRDYICGTGKIYGEGDGDLIWMDVSDQLGGADPLFTEAFGGPGGDIIQGSKHIDFLSGGRGGDSLYGGRGNDVLAGGPSGDYLYGRSGKDDMLGGTGPDVLIGGKDRDHADGFSGNDVIFGGLGNDDSRGLTGNDLIVGGRGADVALGGRGWDECASETMRNCESQDAENPCSSGCPNPPPPFNPRNHP